MDVYQPEVALVLTVLGVLLFLLLAAANAALGTITRQRLHQLVESGRWGADVALALQQDAGALRATMRTLRLLIAALLTATLMVTANGGYSPFLVALVTAGLLLVVEAMGYAIGRRTFVTVAPTLAPVLRLLLWLTAPVRALLGQLRGGLIGEAAEAELVQRQEEEEQRLLATLMGDTEEPLPDDQRQMLQNIVDLEQTSVREVMVPRPDLVTLPSDTTLRAALDTIVKEGHSRIPVYEGNVDNIVGMLYAKDLFADLREGRLDQPIRARLRPPLFVPMSRTAVEVLEQLQRTRIHLAIVFDEYGGTAGLVTIEDILEEIVGEIQDEYDTEEAAFLPLGVDEAIVSGRYDIDDLNSAMDLALPTDENDTVGGLVYSALGRVPTLQDVVRLETHGVTFQVVQMSGRRILKVRVSVTREPSGAVTTGGASLSNDAAEGQLLRYARGFTLW